MKNINVINILKRLWPLALLPIAFNFNAPYMLPYRPYDFLVILILATQAFYHEIKNPNKNGKILFLLALTCGSILFFEAQRLSYRLQVVTSSPRLVRELGEHFIVGFENFDQARFLASRGMVGGFYITTKNIGGRTFEDIAKKINELQSIRERQGLPPLIITADQEGGEISRLNPLIPPTPSLSLLFNDIHHSANTLDLIKNISLQTSSKMKALGINMNLSPVVDLKIRPKTMFNDPHSQIFKRAISDNPQEVIQVATSYAEAMIANGVTPTLKHFPGLGRVVGDTHLVTGHIQDSLDFLEKNDWAPFKAVSQLKPCAIMLGHVIVDTMDPDNPASVSSKMVSYLRKSWGFNGILITDDFAMGPIYKAKGSVGEASIKALNAGVDYILMSYDGSLYYQAMSALLQAAKEGRLNKSLLQESHASL